MPGRAVRSTTERATREGRAPRASAASHRSSGTGAHRHLVGAHDDGQHEDGQGEAARDARVVSAERHDDEGVGEDADGDGGDARHDVGDEADGGRQPAPPVDQEERHRQAHGDGHDRRQPDDDQRADDGVGDAASGDPVRGRGAG